MTLGRVGCDVSRQRGAAASKIGTSWATSTEQLSNMPAAVSGWHLFAWRHAETHTASDYLDRNIPRDLMMLKKCSSVSWFSRLVKRNWAPSCRLTTAHNFWIGWMACNQPLNKRDRRRSKRMREANLSPKCRHLQENVLQSKHIYEQHLVTHIVTVCKGAINQSWNKRAKSHLLSESFLLKIEAFIKLVIRKSQLPYQVIHCIIINIHTCLFHLLFIYMQQAKTKRWTVNDCTFVLGR